MARTDFGPEVKGAMAERPKGVAPNIRQPKAEDAENSEKKTSKDTAGPGDGAQGPMMPRAGTEPRMEGVNPSQEIPKNLPPPHMGPGAGLNAPDAHHVLAAASIAHAILGNRGMR